MRKPYYKQQKIEEDKIKQQEAQKEFDEFVKDPFKDPMQEMIDSLA